MSSIEKLGIRGVRAFSPFDEQKIEFQKPLTMIQGQNGAGKTTLIETLRTMTSGSLPPHTQGGKTFIHDPRISNAAETKACIKLKFNSVKGQPIFALRTFQLTNLKTKQTFKSLESVLKTQDESGKAHSINNKCCEMDRQVPLLMGVSKAILENVIFCHQDEALWPFSDQANLKKIFDEIFDTSKYSKFLEEMRKAIKKYTADAKEKSQQLNLLMKDYSHLERLRSQQKLLTDKLENLKAVMTSQKSDIEEVDKALTDLQEKQMQADKLRASIEEKRLALNFKNRLLHQERNSKLSEAEAADKLKSLEKLANRSGEKKMKKERDRLVKDLQSERSELEIERARVEKYKLELEHLEQALSKYSEEERRVTEKATALKKKAGFKEDADLQKVLKELKQKKKYKEAEADKEARKIEDQARQLKAKIEIEEAKLEIYNKELAETDSKIGTLEKEKRALKGPGASSAQAKLNDLGRSIKQLQDRMISDFRIDLGNLKGGHKQEGARDSFDVPSQEFNFDFAKIGETKNEGTAQLSSEDSKFQALMEIQLPSALAGNLVFAGVKAVADLFSRGQDFQEQIRAFEDEERSAEEQRKQQQLLLQGDQSRTKTAPGLLELKRQKEELMATQARFQELAGIVNKFFRKHKGLNLEVENEEGDLQVVLNSGQEGIATKYDSLKSTLIKFQSASSNIEIVQDHLEDFLESFRSKMGTPASKKKKQPSKSKATTKEQLLLAIEKYVQVESTRKAIHNSIQKLIQFSKSKETCHLCKQSLSSSSIEKMEACFKPDSTSIGMKVEQAKEALSSTLQECLACQSSGGTSEAAEAVEVAEEVIESQLAMLKNRSASVNSSQGQEILNQVIELQQLEARMLATLSSCPQAADFEVEQVRSVEKEIKRLDSAISTSKKEVEALKIKRGKIETQMREISGNFERMKQQLFSLRTEKYNLMSSQKKFTSKQAERQLIEEQLLKLVEAKSRLESQVEEVLSQIRELKGSSSGGDDSLDTDSFLFNEDGQLVQKKMKPRRSRTAMKQEISEQAARSLKKEISKLEAQIEELQAAVYDLDRATNQRKETAAELEAKQDDLEDLEAKEQAVREMREAIALKEDRLRQIEGSLSSNESALEQLRLFQEFLALRKEAADLKAAINKLEDEAKDKDQRGEIRKLEKKRSDLVGLFSENKGQHTAQSQTLKQVTDDLRNRLFDGLEDRVLDQAIQINLAKDMAQEMTDKHDSVEEGLMLYHHEKMKEINRQLSDFWKMTYKGNDIAAIQIKSDQEKDSKRTSRSYNYRVVLVTPEGAELDMKGRCSAGQRVLSSIIIRMSLAETFCQNCGILALDEPTTNLDSENVEGLAQALIEIIESRRQQQSFQLVVITHDQQFLKQLGSRYCETFWTVSKDQNGYSCISEKEIHSILG